MIDPEVRDKIQSLLQPNEKLLWADRPRGIQLELTTLLGLCIGLVLLFAVFPHVPGVILNDIMSGQTAPIVFTILLGAGLLWTIRSIVLPKFETYALTDQRMLIIREIFPKSKASIPLTELRKASSSNRLGDKCVTLLMFKSGMRNTRRFEGAFGIGVPFFRVEGFILHGITDPQGLLALINLARPKDNL